MSDIEVIDSNPEPESNLEPVVPEVVPEPVPGNVEDDLDPLPEDATPEQKVDHKRKGGYQRKLASKQQEVEDARAEAAYYKGILDGKAPQKQPEPAPTVKDGRPDQNQFQSYEDYQEALTDWKVEQKLQAREVQAQTRTFEQKWNVAQDAARSVHDDYDQTVDLRRLSPIITPAMAATLQESDAGPEVLYWLGKNKEECKRISQLTPLAAARELGKVELRITAKPETKPKPTSQAPKPPDPVRPHSAIQNPDRNAGRNEIY